MDINSAKPNFFKRNYMYIIWFVFYFMLAWRIFGLNFTGFMFVLLMYIISLTIAFLPIGEKILRLINQVRSLETKQEKDYLIPVFEDVYTEAKNKYPNLREDIEICTIDVMYINACALGRRTIAVTSGAIDSLSEEELKGFIAHELGHIRNGDTKAELLATVGNGIFTLFSLVSKIILNALESILSRLGGTGFIGFAGFLVFVAKAIFNIIIFLLVYIGELILSINRRKNEYKADEFAYDIGYGNNLVAALYLLKSMCMSDKASLVDRLKTSHPHIAKRIGRLETMIDNNEQM